MPSENYDININLRGKDELSPSLSRAQSALEQFGNIAEITLGVGFGNIMTRAADMVKEFAEESVKRFAEFERQAKTLAYLSHEAGQDVDLLAQAFRSAASAAAADFATSGSQALAVLEALVKAGLSGRDAIQALGSVLALAKIEGADFATAGANVVQVMAQFGLKGQEAARAVDTLVNASRLGIGTANDFAQGLANTGATSRALGLSLEDTATWLVVLERRFGNAQEAGTHLNRLLLDLAEIAAKLGVPIRDAEGNLRNMNDVILDVIAAARAMGGDFTQLQEKLRGVDMRALKALATLAQMSENFSELRSEIGQTGTAMETLNGVLNTTAGRFEQMQATVDRAQRNIGESLSGLAVSLGSVVLPAFQVALARLSVVFAALTGNAYEMKRAILDVYLALGGVTEETAGNMIKSWVEAGEITVAEALKMAESLGIMTPAILELIDLATKAGVEVPEAFKNISSSMDTVAATVDETVQKMTQLQNSIAGLKAESEAYAASASVFDMQIQLVTAGLGEKATKIEAVKNQLDEWRASQERLNAIMSVFNYLQAQARIQLLVLELAEKGLTEQSQNLGETLDMLNQVMADGKISSQEYESMLKALANRFPELRAVIEPVLKLLHDFGNVEIDAGKAGEDVAEQVDEQRRAMDAKAKSVDTLAATIQAYQAVEQRLGFLTQQINTALQVRKALYLEVGDAIDVLSQAENRNFEKTDEWMQQAYQAIDLLVQEGFLTRDQAAALNGLIPVMDTSNDMRERWNNLLAEAVERYKELTSLTREEQITLERLNAISSVLGLTQQALQLQQQALTLEMLGQSEAAEKLRGAFNRLGDAMQDGYIDAEEFQNILKELQYTPFELQFDFTGLEQGFTNLATSIETNMTTAVTNIVTTLQSQVTPALSTMAQTFSQTLNESILPVFTTWEERLSIIQSWYNTYIPSAIQTTATKITELQTKTQEEIVKVGELQTVITAMKDSAVNNIAAIMLQLGNMVQKVDAVARAFSPGVTSSIGEAEKAVQSLASAINSLPSEKTITINIVERRTTVSDEGGAGGGAPTAQHGAWFTHEGLYYLHRGEMVLPRPVAEWFREGSMPVGKTVNVNVNMNIAAASAETDWRRVAEIISREINRNLRAM
ncbi:MAG: phage tail tape measure protein [Candidatus Caldarchaeum sp.]